MREQLETVELFRTVWSPDQRSRGKPALRPHPRSTGSEILGEGSQKSVSVSPARDSDARYNVIEPPV